MYLSRLTFAIDLPYPETIILTLRNITGDIVQTSSENTGAGIFTKEMNLEKLSSGIYILQILSNEKIYFKKIIKQ
ncbi:MAG: T9SS type A sorting domain-containing protein [Bacteroidetes bacterium]|nr:T9SS type A sorting domain-containing protein [Bacteroidota bacterium]